MANVTSCLGSSGEYIAYTASKDAIDILTIGHSLGRNAKTVDQIQIHLLTWQEENSYCCKRLTYYEDVRM